MKTKYLFLIIAVLFTTFSYSQGLLNKLKNKANQEVNKLEKGSTSSIEGSQPNKNKLGPTVTRSVVVKLGTDETFDYSENCIDLGASMDQVSFILSKQNGNSLQCYAYKNGTRTPVACPTGSNSGCQTSLQCSYSALKEIQMNEDEFKKYVSTETDAHTFQAPTISDQQMKMMAAYMTPAQIDELKKNMAEAQKQNGQTYSTMKSNTIAFNGKKYGPYKLVSKFYLTPDGLNFYAIAGESKDPKSSQIQNKLITSASARSIILGDYDSPLLCFASHDNAEFGYVAFGSSGQKYVVKVSSGKTYEMPITSGFSGAWFSAAGNHVLFLSQTELSFDGQVIKTFANDEYPKACDLFVSSDGKGVTVIKDNKVSFADGDYFEYPLKMAIVNVAGKPYYKWLALENNEVVVYQKPY
jgi:hypothetical protein